MKIVIRQIKEDQTTAEWSTETTTADDADHVMRQVETVIGEDFTDLTELAICTTRDISALWKGGQER